MTGSRWIQGVVKTGSRWIQGVVKTGSHWIQGVVKTGSHWIQRVVKTVLTVLCIYQIVRNICSGKSAFFNVIQITG